MPIRIDPAVDRAVYEREGTLVIQVTGVGDVERAAAALEGSIDDLLSLGGGPESADGLGPGETNSPHSIHVLATAETGPVIFLDPGSTPSDLLLKVPGILASHLERAGVASGRLTVPSIASPFDDLFRYDRRFATKAVVLLIAFPVDETGRVPTTWLDEAVDWLTHASAATDLSGRVSHVIHVTIPLDGARPLIERGNGTDLNIQLVLRRTDDVIATATLAPIPGRARLVLAAGDPAGRADVSTLFEEAKKVAHRLAGDALYVFVSVQDSFDGVSTGWHDGDVIGNMARPESVAELADELVLDAFPYQVLSEGHLRKLGRIPEGSDELDAGRVGVPISDLSHWLSSKRGAHRKLLEHGRALLMPCIRTDEEAFAMVKERLRGRA